MGYSNQQAPLSSPGPLPSSQEGAYPNQALDMESGVWDSRPLQYPIGLLCFLKGGEKRKRLAQGPNRLFSNEAPKAESWAILMTWLMIAIPLIAFHPVLAPLNHQRSRLMKPEGWHSAVFVSFA